MIHPIDAGKSAVQAFSRKMDVTANNVANVSTDGYKTRRTALEERASGGVSASVSPANTPGSTKEVVIDGRVQAVETSNVDLAEELTETISTSAGYRANLKTIRTQDEMIGTLLDTIG